MIAVAYGMAGASIRTLQPPIEPDRDRDTPDRDPTPEELEREEDARDLQRRLDAWEADREARDTEAYTRWLAGEKEHPGALPKYWSYGEGDEGLGRIPGAAY